MTITAQQIREKAKRDAHTVIHDLVLYPCGNGFVIAEIVNIFPEIDQFGLLWGDYYKQIESDPNCIVVKHKGFRKSIGGLIGRGFETEDAAIVELTKHML